jgi:hypothetical protein
LKTGGFRVGVHITDVSSFVEIKSELDKEARERGIVPSEYKVGTVYCNSKIFNPDIKSFGDP